MWHEATRKIVVWHMSRSKILSRSYLPIRFGGQIQTQYQFAVCHLYPSQWINVLCSPMRPVHVLSSEDEDEELKLSSVSSITASGRLSDASTFSSDSIWDQVTDWEPYIARMESDAQPTCVPSLFDSRKNDPSVKDKRKFYNVYVGDLVGCFREWYVRYR